MEAYLSREAEAFRKEGIHKTSKEIAIGESISDMITEYAQESNCDLILLYTHGRNGLRSMALSSITHNVVNRSHIPSITIRPRREYVD